MARRKRSVKIMTEEWPPRRTISERRRMTANLGKSRTTIRIIMKTAEGKATGDQERKTPGAEDLTTTTRMTVGEEMTGERTGTIMRRDPAE